MAVYTELQEEVLRDFLYRYDLGEFQSFSGIAEGVENSNFLLRTSQGRFILTLFEKRMDPAELPWFLGFMGHLAEQGIACPAPLAARDGTVLHELAGRPAVIVSFLNGRALKDITPDACEQVGQSLARLHEAGRGYKAERPNALGPQGWVELFARCTDGGDSDVAALIDEVDKALTGIVQAWPKNGDLPRGQIHADLFDDNVFFEDSRLSGVIDFYFACTDFLAYDLAICLNAWCFEDEKEYRPERAEALIQGYEQVRPLSQKEHEALAVLCQGAALRFLLTRLYDWVNTPAGAMVTRKDPWAYQRRLRHFQKASMSESATEDSSTPMPHVQIWTDGGCKPNPGPGGWGVLLRCQGHERIMKGGEAETTNNRMELTAAAIALETLKRPCVVDLYTDSEYLRNGIMRWHTGWVRRNWRNASGDPVANMDLWQRILDIAKRHQVEWHWVKAHAGHEENERVDQLATEGREELEAQQGDQTL